MWSGMGVYLWLYLEATDYVADDFFNGLLKLGKSIDQAHVRDKRQ